MKTTTKESTKIKILKTAFSFYKKPCLTHVSLGDIAKKAGISKAAIFKHFRNKEELLSQMEDHFFSVVADFILSTYKNLADAIWAKDVSIYRIILRNSVKTFFENPEYLFYMLSLLAYAPKGNYYLGEKLNHKLEERGLSLCLIGSSLGVNYSTEQSQIFDISKHTAISYAFASTFFFLSYHILNSENTEMPDQKEVLCTFLADLLDFGFYKPENRISTERMKEIEKSAVIDFSKIPEPNPFFKALASIVNTCGLPGVTIERLAKELGMAKSSLYTYSSSKNEFIFNLLREELTSMISVLNQVCKNFKNNVELSYAFIYTATQYFLNRKDVLVTFQWIRMTGRIFPDTKNLAENIIQNLDDDADSFGLQENDTSSFKMQKETFYSWLSAVASSFVLQKNNHNLSDEQIFEIIRICFSYIQSGLTNCNSNK